ncbi:MAG: transcription antitermination factor NusB [Myxococcales bacterium]|nr:transcription antitermination factor NusB [Myxococcales bacterium]
MTYSRRRARESALQILYGLDWSAADVAFAIEDYWAKFAGEKPDGFQLLRDHCGELVRGVVDNRQAIDQRLSATAQHWKMERMSAVDRNILRLAAFELLHMGDQVPRNVAINEAVEIAKKYGNEDSSAFVNGVLDRLATGRGVQPADAMGERNKTARLQGKYDKRKKSGAAAKSAATAVKPSAIKAPDDQSTAKQP